MSEPSRDRLKLWLFCTTFAALFLLGLAIFFKYNFQVETSSQELPFLAETYADDNPLIKTYSPGFLNYLLEAGYRVLILVGADWDVTAKFNEAMIAEGKIDHLIVRHNLVVMYLDCTDSRPPPLRGIGKNQLIQSSNLIVYSPLKPDWPAVGTFVVTESKVQDLVEKSDLPWWSWRW